MFRHRSKWPSRFPKMADFRAFLEQYSRQLLIGGIILLLGGGFLVVSTGIGERYGIGLSQPFAGGPDFDEDTVPDNEDNCPDVYNKQQTDDDGDGIGNRCDDTPVGEGKVDTDGDGFSDDVDNCPEVFNVGQGDYDGDGTGNSCDDTPFHNPDRNTTFVVGQATLKVTCTRGRWADLTWNSISFSSVNALERHKGDGWEVLLEEKGPGTTFKYSDRLLPENTSGYRVRTGDGIYSNVVTCKGAPVYDPNAALPAPNHAMDFGYYFVDGRYGDFRHEVACYTNTYYAWAESGYALGSDWKSQLRTSLENAVSDGKKIHLNLNQHFTTSLDDVLEVAAPFWSTIVRLEFADEPGWDQGETESRIAALESKMAALGLGDRPIGIVYDNRQIFESSSPLASNLDWVGIEAYIDPPGSGNSQANIDNLNEYVTKAKSRVPTSKDIVLVMQAYARNGAWTNIATLTDLQIPTYLLAYSDPRVVAINMFAYARPSGTRQHQQLIAPHKLIGEKILSKTCSTLPATLPSPSPTPAPTVTLQPSPIVSQTPSPTPVLAPTPAPVFLNEGNMISAYGTFDPDIYVINEWGYKRPIFDPSIFAMYGHLTGGYPKVKTVTYQVRDSYITSALFRNCETQEEQVYALSVVDEFEVLLHKVNISGADAVQQDQNFFKKVFCINTRELNWYQKSDVEFRSVAEVPRYQRR